MLICLSSNDVEEGHIQVNKVIHNNLRVKLGDLVEFTNILWQACAYFTLWWLHWTANNIFDIYLKAYLFEGTCPTN